MITAKEMTENVGRTGMFSSGGLSFGVTIHDARVRFGEVDYLITPVSGLGTKWVASHNVKVGGN